MPLYEYSCSSCGVVFEHLSKEQKDSEICPSCGKVAGKKLSIPGQFSFVGAGPHVNEHPSGDRLIGKDAELRWKVILEREEAKKEVRKSGQNPVLVKMDNKPLGGTGNPMTTKDSDLPKKDDFVQDYLGAPKSLISARKEAIGEYSEALSEHRKKRKAQGLGQYDKPPEKDK